MFNQEKHADRNKKAYQEKKALINQTNYDKKDIEQSSSFEGKDDLLAELSDVRTQLVTAREDLKSASFDGKSTEDFLIIQRSTSSNNYLASVTAVEAASLVKSLVEAGQKINIGWELA